MQFLLYSEYWRENYPRGKQFCLFWVNQQLSQKYTILILLWVNENYPRGKQFCLFWVNQQLSQKYTILILLYGGKRKLSQGKAVLPILSKPKIFPKNAILFLLSRQKTFPKEYDSAYSGLTYIYLFRSFCFGEKKNRILWPSFRKTKLVPD